MKDVLFDVHTLMMKSSHAPGKIHSGFGIQQRRLTRLCDQELQVRLSKPRSVFVCTGHSAGAAIALLTACQLSGCHGDSVSVVGFGMPRIGDAAFVHGAKQCLGDRLLLLKNGYDVVVDLPPFNGYASFPHMSLGAKSAKLTLRGRLNDRDIATYQQRVMELAELPDTAWP
jgi:Lipase (class 3)